MFNQMSVPPAPNQGDSYIVVDNDSYYGLPKGEYVRDQYGVLITKKAANFSKTASDEEFSAKDKVIIKRAGYSETQGHKFYIKYSDNEGRKYVIERLKEVMDFEQSTLENILTDSKYDGIIAFGDYVDWLAKYLTVQEV